MSKLEVLNYYYYSGLSYIMSSLTSMYGKSGKRGFYLSKPCAVCAQNFDYRQPPKKKKPNAKRTCSTKCAQIWSRIYIKNWNAKNRQRKGAQIRMPKSRYTEWNKVRRRETVRRACRRFQHKKDLEKFFKTSYI